MSGKNIVRVVFAVICAAAFLLGDAQGASARSELAAPAAFARQQETVVSERLIERFDIDTRPQVIVDYLCQAFPQLTSEAAFERRRHSLLVITDALEEVRAGGDPNEIFVSSGQKAAGVDPKVWEFYARETATEAFIVDVRRQARSSYGEFLFEAATHLRRLYLEAEISARLCELPEVASQVDAYFAGFYPPEVTVPAPLPGEREFQCRRLARLWVLDFARQVVGEVDDGLEGWELHLELLREWDGSPLRSSGRK